MNNMFPKAAIWLVIALVLFTVFKQFDSRQARGNDVAYSQFMDQARDGQLESVTIDGRTLRGRTRDGSLVTTFAPTDVWMVGDLMKYGVQVTAKPEEEQSLLFSIFVSWFPMLLLIGVWVFFMRQMQGGGRGGAFSFGKSRARMLDESSNSITFADVAGCDEAKEEVQELVDFLRDPSKFQKLGGRIPRGVLMVGSPGTGKTLLAKAIAGEAKVPFFTISGSDFVEMFVGVGAARVRDMFENAKKHAPCIVFIDEIDAVGRQRGAGLGGGNDEREQTLNQLLVEMDGFETGQGIIVIAATNRPDVLDPALMRPGRFDRQVVVPLPDIRGREQILEVHMRKVPIAADVRPDVIARGCPGFSGADLANLVNEASLYAARRNARLVEMNDFEQAKDKIMMGAERRSMVMTEEDRIVTAYHESGHAVVGKVIKGADPIHKVTIIPRGRALGVTFFLPERDRYGFTAKQLLAQIAVAFGGRVAEEVFLDQKSTGALSDYEQATNIAREMVTRYGMSDALSPMIYAENEGEVFLGRSVTRTTSLSDSTMQKVDSEIRRIVDDQYALARKILEENRDKVELMAKTLLEWETIDANQVEEIMSGKLPTPPRTTSPTARSSSGGGTPPALEPVVAVADEVPKKSPPADSVEPASS